MNYPLYIHIPYCLSKCDYCDFFSVPIGNLTEKNAVCGGSYSSYNREMYGEKKSVEAGLVPNEYITALCNEISYRKKMYTVEKWSTIYIGGGTPSLLSPLQIKTIAECVLNDSAHNVEFTMEANPADISLDFLQCLADCGVNRLSLGIQAFDDASLSCVNRRSTLRDVETSLELVKSRWNGEFSADLISALPLQTEKSFVLGVKRLLDYKPNHISLYSLTIEEETPLFKRINSNEIPYNYDDADALWLLGKKMLEENGWRAYEISNFYNEKNGRPCAHNMAYWKMKSYIGVGSGGTGSVYGKKSIRYTNIHDIAKYIDFWRDCQKREGDGRVVKNAEKVNAQSEQREIEVDVNREILLPEALEVLKKSDEEMEFFMMGLRLYEGVCLEDFESRFSKKIPRHYYDVMNLWKKHNRARYYKKHGKEWFCLSKKGILFLNGFMKDIIGGA